MRLAVLAFLGGILLLQIQASLPPPWLIHGLAALACLALGVGWTQGSGRRRGLILLGMVLLGFAWAGGRAQERMSEVLPAEWEGRAIALTGVVASLPQRFEQGERCRFDVESVHTQGAIVPRHIQLAWYHAGNESDAANGAEDAGMLRPGERWRFTVRLRQARGNANPHAFDYEAWLLERNIRAVGTIAKNGEQLRLAGFVFRPGYLVERLRDALRQRFLAAMPDAPYLGVLIALAIGDQRSIPGEQWTVFNRTGVTHLVSISGLHVTMIAALFAGLANALWRRSERLMLRLPAQKLMVAAGWLAALVYSLLAGFEVPAQRTFYMLSVVALALWSGRHLSVSRTLSLALLLVLIVDPWAVLSTGFWLSFGAVAVLFYVGTARLGQPGGWRVAAVRWGLAQWAVTVASLPVLLFFFQQFSLVSPLANALAIPFVSLVITPLALLFAVLPWPPLVQLAHGLLAQAMDALASLAAWPVWQQPAPPLWASLLALAGVVWLLLPRGFPARWLGFSLLLPALLWQAPRPPHGEAWVEVLDVGQGLAVVVRTARHALLYDTGPRYSADADAGQRIVVPFLRASGVTALDTLVVSHQDKDHSGGLTTLRTAVPIGRLLTSAAEFDGEKCIAGQGWTWDGVRFTILHPAAGDYDGRLLQSNDLSCVLKVEAFGQGLLLTGDIEAKGEHALLGRAGETLRSEAIIVPHHGSRSSSTAAFIAAVGARDAVFSVGYRNAFGHPHPAVLARYAGSRHWRTDRGGAIRLVLGTQIGARAWREERRRYWHPGSF